METQYIGLPGSLFDRVKETAANEEITPEEFVRNAVETRLNKRELDEVFAFGKSHAKARGLKPSDVARAIADVRAGQKQQER